MMRCFLRGFSKIAYGRHEEDPLLYQRQVWLRKEEFWLENSRPDIFPLSLPPLIPSTCNFFSLQRKGIWRLQCNSLLQFLGWTYFSNHHVGVIPAPLLLMSKSPLYMFISYLNMMFRRLYLYFLSKDVWGCLSGWIFFYSRVSSTLFNSSFNFLHPSSSSSFLSLFHMLSLGKDMKVNFNTCSRMVRMIIAFVSLLAVITVSQVYMTEANARILSPFLSSNIFRSFMTVILVKSNSHWNSDVVNLALRF